MSKLVERVTRVPAVRSRTPWIFILIGVALTPLTATADTVQGPLRAELVRVIDGDTIEVIAEPWPDIFVKVDIRIDGVDTPELRGKCDEEKALAIRARDFVRSKLLLADDVVFLKDVRPGKYAGRVVARVYVSGDDLAQLLIANDLGRVYDGSRRLPWCN